MKKNDILYDIDEQVLVYGEAPLCATKKYLGKIIGIQITESNICYQVKIDKIPCVIRNQIDVFSPFQEDQYVKIKINDIEIIGEIMGIDEGTEYFDLRISDDGKYITPCWKSEIVEYIVE